VDGRDGTVFRRATFAVHPSPGQERALHRLVGVCREVYNAALQERRDAYRTAGVTVTWQDQFKQVTQLRGVRDDALVFGVQPVRSAIMRCDAAMQAFFARAKAGATPGYPRFKGARRFNTASWDEPVSWRLLGDADRLRLQGVGEVRLSKSARRQIGRMTARGGVATTLTVTRRRARRGWVWRATVGFTGVTVECPPPTHGDGSVVGADRGVKVTLATSDERLLTMPRYVAAARNDVVALQQAQARKQKYSREWRRLGRQIARGRRKAAAQVDNWARDIAKQLIAEYDVLAIEDLKLAAMTRSAKGTIEQPGTNVAQKQGLNRELQDAALGRLAVRVCVKAASAGRRVWMVNPPTRLARAPGAATQAVPTGPTRPPSPAKPAVTSRTRTSTQRSTSPRAAGTANRPGRPPARHRCHADPHAGERPPNPGSNRLFQFHRGRVGSEATSRQGRCRARNMKTSSS
jgi:putative transposase